jgi:hypothetical protein
VVKLVQAVIGLLDHQGLFVPEFADDVPEEHLGVRREVLTQAFGEGAQHFEVHHHDVHVAVVY